MTNQFAHLKNTKNSKNVDDFIDGATKERAAKKAKKNIKKEDILLSISGRIDREQEHGKLTLIYVKDDISNDINKHCHGNKQSIYNYLMRRGLDELIEDDEFILATE